MVCVCVCVCVCVERLVPPPPRPPFTCAQVNFMQLMHALDLLLDNLIALLPRGLWSYCPQAEAKERLPASLHLRIPSETSTDALSVAESSAPAAPRGAEAAFVGLVNQVFVRLCVCSSAGACVSLTKCAQARVRARARFPR